MLFARSEELIKDTNVHTNTKPYDTKHDTDGVGGLRHPKNFVAARWFFTSLLYGDILTETCNGMCFIAVSSGPSRTHPGECTGRVVHSRSRLVAVGPFVQ